MLIHNWQSRSIRYDALFHKTVVPQVFSKLWIVHEYGLSLHPKHQEQSS